MFGVAHKDCLPFSQMILIRAGSSPLRFLSWEMIFVNRKRLCEIAQFNL